MAGVPVTCVFWYLHFIHLNIHDIFIFLREGIVERSDSVLEHLVPFGAPNGHPPAAFLTWWAMHLELFKLELLMIGIRILPNSNSFDLNLEGQFSLKARVKEKRKNPNSFMNLSENMNVFFYIFLEIYLIL